MAASRAARFFPAALVAFDDLTAADTPELLGTAPDPTSAAALITEQITAALARARRHDRNRESRGDRCRAAPSAWANPQVVTAAYAATVRAQAAILTVLNTEIKTMQEQARLVDALGLQAFAVPRAHPACGYYDQLRDRGVRHRAVLGQLGNRLVGILRVAIERCTSQFAHSQSKTLMSLVSLMNRIVRDC